MYPEIKTQRAVEVAISSSCFGERYHLVKRYYTSCLGREKGGNVLIGARKGASGE